MNNSPTAYASGRHKDLNHPLSDLSDSLAPQGGLIDQAGVGVNIVSTSDEMVNSIPTNQGDTASSTTNGAGRFPDFVVSPHPHATNGNVRPDEGGTAYTPGGGQTNTSGGASGLAATTNNPSLFWSSPLTDRDELNWFVPPLPYIQEADAATVAMLSEFARTMEHQPRRAWLLNWNYRTRSAAAAAEQVHVEQEAQAFQARLNRQSERELIRLDDDMVRLDDQRQALERQLMEAQNAFAEAAARAGLHCEVPLPEAEPAPARLPFWRSNRSKAEEQEEEEYGIDSSTEHPGKITPQVVEDALLHSGPSQDELAGEYGIAPVGREDMLARILSFFMQFLAPLVAGMMLALCLGTLVGILDIDTLQRPDSAAQLILSAALGFVIVYLMGELFHTTVATLARSLELRDPDQMREVAVPRFRGNLRVAVSLMTLAVGLGLAEVTAEGMGIRQLHEQQIAKQNRFRSVPAPQTNQPAGAVIPSVPRDSEELPIVLYLLIGTLISGPYLGYKSAKGWSENETLLREAWLLHRQRLWLDNRRTDHDVQQAFHHAYNVERIENNLTRTRIQLQMLEEERMRILNMELPEHLQSRRRDARAAAVGEAARLQQSLEDLVEVYEPLSKRPQLEAVEDTNYRPDRRSRTGNRR